MDHLDQTVGNTNTTVPTTKKFRSWAITVNNPTQTPDQMDQIFRSLGCEAWIFQLEKGSSGTPHYQGCFRFKSQRVWPKEEFPGAHLEPCRDWRKSIVYCQKLEGRLAGPWSHGVVIKPTLKVITDLYPWQQAIVDRLKTPAEDRKILWVWEPNGNVGKTQLCKLICATNRNAIFVGSGKPSDVKYAIAAMLQDERYPEVVLFGLPREYEHFKVTVLEEVKDGIFFSSKYESGMVMFNSPHIIVFANRPPDDMSGLTPDRWEIYTVNDIGGGLAPQTPAQAGPPAF